ncbi:MAG: hypothetical protein GC206_12735 [Alphaproteobacteria bacterium]|nr:hypothetical protein [Alphaproteobacteria bacterium]
MSLFRPFRGLRRGLKAALIAAAAATAAAGVLSCSESDSGGVRETRFDDNSVAAKVNGRPIYHEDVRDFAVRNGRLREGEELTPGSDVYHLALQDLITQRLFAREAETRGLDRDPDVRRALDAARERILASAIYSEIENRATDPDTIERRYKQTIRDIGETPEVLIRHIQLDTREAASAAIRRLNEGERFEDLAFQLSRDVRTRSEGGDIGWALVDSLPDGFRQAVDSHRVGDTAGPIQTELGWHVIQIRDRRQRGAPSLAALRGDIVNHLRFEGVESLRDRLQSQVRIEIAATGGPAEAPAESETGDRPSAAPAPNAPSDIPMGPGGVAAAGQPDDAPDEPPPPAAEPAPAEERET